MGYYEDLIQNIDKYIKNEDYTNAKELIEEELKMSYVPSDVLEKLYEFKDSIPKESLISSLSEDDIVNYLKGTLEQQLIAVDYLDSKNLRDYINICNEFLCSKGIKNAKVLLIYSLIKQEITDDIKYIDNDVEYNFIPRFIMLPEESPGYKKALDYLNEWYMKEPSKFELAKSLVYKEAMMALPINYEEIEGESLAKKAYDAVKKAFN